MRNDVPCCTSKLISSSPSAHAAQDQQHRRLCLPCTIARSSIDTHHVAAVDFVNLLSLQNWTAPVISNLKSSLFAGLDLQPTTE